MRTLTVVWIGTAGVLGWHAQVSILAVAGIVFLANQLPRKAHR
jgi:hypothetical protein